MEYRSKSNYKEDNAYYYKNKLMKKMDIQILDKVLEEVGVLKIHQTLKY